MLMLKQIGRVHLIIGLLLLSSSLSSSASAQVVVETFTATETYDFVMPGTPGASGIDFNYAHSFDTITFTPGSVTFLGQPVDFSGTEAAFIATSNSDPDDLCISALGGPATASGEGTTGADGPGYFGSGVPIELVPLELGAGFSASNLDIVVSSAFNLSNGVNSGAGADFTVPLIPELDGATISFQGTSIVSTVNPVTGEVTVSTTGQIIATKTLSVPMLSGWGVVLLAACLLGIGAIEVWRSRYRSGDITA